MEIVLPWPVRQAEPSPGLRGGSGGSEHGRHLSKVAQPALRSQGQLTDLLPPGPECLPLAGGVAAGLFWQTFAIKHFVFGMSRVQEKCLLAGNFPAFVFFFKQ